MIQKNDNSEYVTPEGYKLRPYKEALEEVSLKIPVETMKVLKKVAESRDLPVGALLRMFVSQGLRVELQEKFPELQRELFEKRFRNRKKNHEAEMAKIEAETKVDLAA